MAKHIDLGRLAGAMQRARLTLRRFREERAEAVRQYVGNHWSELGAQQKVPVNLIALYLSVVARSLISKSPRVLLTTFQRQHKPMVTAMNVWANKEVDDMGLANTLRRCVIDGLFSIGIAKVALAAPADAARLAWNLAAGKPFCERVDLDDFVYDIHARDFSEVTFIGHRYRAPLEVIRDSKIYAKQRKDLSPSVDDPYNLEGDERISTFGRGYYGANAEEFEDFVDLWEVYLPGHKVVLTLANDQLTGPTGGGAASIDEPLRVQDWLGPDTGPYHLLAYGVVPGNAMPKAPIQDLIDLHELVNILYRKLGRQAERQKTVLGVAAGATEDGSRVMEADDGTILRLDNPDRMKEVSFGGPNPQNFAIMEHAKKLFTYLAGNLDMMGGLSPQSKTATQDKLLAQNASGGVADLQERTTAFTSEIMSALCWYWWHDPFKVMKSSYSLPGLPDMPIERQVTPEQRAQGRYEDVDIRVDPYSMQHKTPEARLAALNQVVQTIITPMMPLLQQQGIAFDINAYLSKVAQYLDMPDLAEIVTMRDPPQPESASGADKPGMPAQTERTYTRENVPGRTEQGDTMNRVNSLMGVETGGASDGEPSMNGAA